MKKLSLLNKILYFINSITLFILIVSYLSPYLSPLIFWPIAFTGLIFPIIYLINIIFLFYWSVGLKKPMWANIIILLIGIGNFSNYFGTSPNNDSSEKNVKVLTYNVRLFNKYNWLETKNIKEKILNFLKKENVDILCIQEFYITDSIPKINFPYIHIAKNSKKSKWNMAIYTKYPQIFKGKLNIKDKQMYNTCIYSDIIIKTDTIRIYNIHLASNWFNDSDYAFILNPKKEKIKEGIHGIVTRMSKSYKKRAIEVNQIKKHIVSCPYPVILCGDFNDIPQSFAYQKIKGDMTDSFSSSGKGIGESFVKIPGLRIDYILHEKDFQSTNYKQHNEIFSDHYAVSCEIIIP